jgi:hypothetical protein
MNDVDALFAATVMNEPTGDTGTAMRHTEAISDCVDHYVALLDRSLTVRHVELNEIDTAAELAELLMDKGDNRSTLRAHQVLAEVAQIGLWSVSSATDDVNNHITAPPVRAPHIPLAAWVSTASPASRPASQRASASADSGNNTSNEASSP